MSKITKTIKGARLRNTVAGGMMLGRIALGRGAAQEISIADLTQAIKVSNGGKLGGPPGISTMLASGDIIVGNASGVAAAVALSGDGSITNAGVLTVTKSGGVAFGSAAFTSSSAYDAAGTAAAYFPVSNANLAHSSMTLAGHTVSLGGTQTFASSDLTDGPLLPLAGGTMTGQLNGTNLTETGWLSVGSASTPANTTAGDLTCQRLSIGNSSLVPGNGEFLFASNTGTDTSGTVVGYGFFNYLSPASNSPTNNIGFSIENIYRATVNYTGDQKGITFENRVIKAGTIALAIGGYYFGLEIGSSATACGAVTSVIGADITSYVNSSGSINPAVTTATGTKIESPTPGGSTITTAYGVRIAAQKVTNVTTGYGLAGDGASDNNYLVGSLLVGATGAAATSAILDLSSTIGALRIPRMTTTQRNALTPVQGLTVYDSTLHASYDYVNGSWQARAYAGSIPADANPSATASDTAVNGSATTFMRSDAAPAVQKGSASQFGIVKVDGTTITASGGVISAAGGSGGAMTMISDTTTSGSAASVTISSIAATYKDLILVVSGASGGAVSSDLIKLQFNGDTGSNYDWMDVHYSGTNNNSVNTSGNADTAAGAGRLVGTSGTASYSMSSEITIPNYAATTFFKNYKATGGGAIAGTSANVLATANGGVWRSTAAINAINVALATGPFADGTRVTLYGRA